MRVFPEDDFEHDYGSFGTGRDIPITFRFRSDADAMAGLALPPTADERYADARNALITEAKLAADVGRCLSYSRRRDFYTRTRRYYGDTISYRTVLAAVNDGVDASLLVEQRAIQELAKKWGCSDARLTATASSVCPWPRPIDGNSPADRRQSTDFASKIWWRAYQQLFGIMDSLPRFKLVAEAARELRKGERWLRDWLKRHPVDRDGLPFYRSAGRTKLLTDHDIDRIRENLPCPSPSYRRKLAARRTTIFAAPISELTEPRALLKNSEFGWRT